MIVPLGADRSSSLSSEYVDMVTSPQESKSRRLVRLEWIDAVLRNQSQACRVDRLSTAGYEIKPSDTIRLNGECEDLVSIVAGQPASSVSDAVAAFDAYDVDFIGRQLKKWDRRGGLRAFLNSLGRVSGTIDNLPSLRSDREWG